jgi:hypothetical protein
MFKTLVKERVESKGEHLYAKGAESRGLLLSNWVVDATQPVGYNFRSWMYTLN